MQDINTLSNALRAGSQSKAKLSGLDEQYERANALRNSAGPAINQYGTVSPLGVLANVMNQSQGRKQLRELKPQREAARLGIANNENAAALYGAQQNLNKFDYQKQSDTAKAGALVKAAQAKADVDAGRARTLAEAKASAQGKPEAWVNKDGTGQVTGSQTDAGFVDKDNNLIDISGKIPYKEFSVATNEVGDGVGKTSAKDVLGFKKTIRAVDDTYKAIGDMTEGDRATFNDKGSQLKNILIKTLSPAGFEAIAEDSLAGYSPATKRMLVTLNKMSGEERNRLFGGALTPTELSSSRDFLPAVMGRGLDWIVSTLEAGKRSSANSLYDMPDQKQWLIDSGIVGADYVPAQNKLGYDPLAPVTPEKAPTQYTQDQLMNMSDAEFDAYEAAQTGGTK